MRKLLAALVIVVSLALLVGLNTMMGDVEPQVEMRPFPLPLKNVSGLSFDGSALWITVEGEKTISRVDPDTGRVLHRIPFPVEETGGSAWDGRHLWQLAYLEKKIYKLDVNSGETLCTLGSPGEGMCCGMTFDGRYLWVVNFEDKKIYQIDQNRGGEIINAVDGYFEATGLAWDGRYLWNGILVGTETHDEETPFTGFVQQRSLTSQHPLMVFSVPGVGPGSSDWTASQRSVATRFWWYDGYHKEVVQVKIGSRAAWNVRLIGLMFCILSGVAVLAGGLGGSPRPLGAKATTQENGRKDDQQQCDLEPERLNAKISGH